MLDEHLSRLDAATLTVRAADKRAAMLRLSFLREQREELLSEGVPLRALGELCETALGKMLDAKRVAGKATPYLRNINVRWGSIDLGDVQTVPLSEQEQHRFALQRGDVLVCEGGEPGRCAVWTGEQSPMTFQKALHRVRSRGDMAPAFVAMMIEEFIRSGRADRLFTGTTIKHLPQEKLRAIPLPAPDRERQSTILERLASIDASVGHLRLGCARAARRSVALRRSLMCRAFAGSLTDEAAFSVAPPE
jgi:type I restriction enzyme S subunit